MGAFVGTLEDASGRGFGLGYGRRSGAEVPMLAASGGDDGKSAGALLTLRVGARANCARSPRLRVLTRPSGPPVVAAARLKSRMLRAAHARRLTSSREDQ